MGGDQADAVDTHFFHATDNLDNGAVGDGGVTSEEDLAGAFGPRFCGIGPKRLRRGPQGYRRSENVRNRPGRDQGGEGVAA